MEKKHHKSNAKTKVILRLHFVNRNHFESMCFCKCRNETRYNLLFLQYLSVENTISYSHRLLEPREDYKCKNE